MEDRRRQTSRKGLGYQTERALYSDTKFKKYVKIIETTLASFDSVSEWADFISFLARLHKAMQAYPNFNAIPRKLIVAKRLANVSIQRSHQAYINVRSMSTFTSLASSAQKVCAEICMSGPAASCPSFSTLPPRSSPPCSPSTRPFTSHCRMTFIHSQRPFRWLCFLDSKKRRASTMSEPSRLLDSISDAVTQPFFLQNLWLTLITTPSVRLAALNYLTRRMPSVQDEKDPTVLVGKDLGLMVRGLAHASMTTCFWFVGMSSRSSSPMCRSTSPCSSRLSSVPIRSSSFAPPQRRPAQGSQPQSSPLHVALGADESPEAQIAFLRQHGLDLIRAGLKQDLDKDHSNAADRQKPYRIFVSLLDKWEIGQSLTRVLALDAFHAISLAVAKGQEEELMTTAKMLFEVVDPFLLYGRFLEAIIGQFGPDSASIRRCLTINSRVSSTRGIGANCTAVNRIAIATRSPLLCLQSLSHSRRGD